MPCSLRTAGLAAVLVLASAILPAGLAGRAHADDRSLPMRFDLRRQGPADACGATCKTWISASGAITADSGRDFVQFMRGRSLKNAVVVLDSDGGSVLGALALGRAIRHAGLATTVGRTVDLDDKDAGKAGKNARATAAAEPRAHLSPRADCESMCAFVLLGGVQRTVPPQARVMVHQIWLGDRREDPTAATYSAEDLVLVQHDIGQIARFTAEMGASIDLLDLALRIPPWEPLHTMTRDEIRQTKLVTDETPETAPATVATSAPVVVPPAQAVTNGVRATPISERRWVMVDMAGNASLARRHPLTVEGDNIGSFDLIVSCGADMDSFDLGYAERRRSGDGQPLASRLSAVSLRVGRNEAKLRVSSSERGANPDELVSRAVGTVPAALIRDFAGVGDRSMVIETEAKGMVTVIRIGNTGAQQSLPQLVSRCAKPVGDRAEVAVTKTGGMASAR